MLETKVSHFSKSYLPVMLVVEEHAFLEEVQFSFVSWVFGVIGFGTHLLTHCGFLKIKLTNWTHSKYKYNLIPK